VVDLSDDADPAAPSRPSCIAVSPTSRYAELSASLRACAVVRVPQLVRSRVGRVLRTHPVTFKHKLLRPMWRLFPCLSATHSVTVTVTGHCAQTATCMLVTCRMCSQTCNEASALALDTVSSLVYIAAVFPRAPFTVVLVKQSLHSMSSRMEVPLPGTRCSDIAMQNNEQGTGEGLVAAACGSGHAILQVRIWDVLSACALQVL
jgi:hypothetical protein